MILEPKKISLSLFPLFPPSIWHEAMGPDAMILAFLMLNFKPTFSLSSFTFTKRLFSSSSFSTVRVVSSAYLRLLMLLPIILISACSSSLLFCVKFSAYKLNKQGDSVQPWHTPFPILNQSHCSMFDSKCCFLTCIQVRWSGIPICCDPHSQRFQNSQWSRSRYVFRICLLSLLSSGCWKLDLWFLCLF